MIGAVPIGVGNAPDAVALSAGRRLGRGTGAFEAAFCADFFADFAPPLFEGDFASADVLAVPFLSDVLLSDFLLSDFLPLVLLDLSAFLAGAFFSALFFGWIPLAAVGSSVFGFGAAWTTAAAASNAARLAIAAVNEPLRVKSKPSPSESDGAAFAIALNMLRNRLPSRSASLPSESGETAAQIGVRAITGDDRSLQEHSLSSRWVTGY